MNLNIDLFIIFDANILDFELVNTRLLILDQFYFCGAFQCNIIQSQTLNILVKNQSQLGGCFFFGFSVGFQILKLDFFADMIFIFRPALIGTISKNRSGGDIYSVVFWQPAEYTDANICRYLSADVNNREIFAIDKGIVKNSTDTFRNRDAFKSFASKKGIFPNTGKAFR